ncbi:methyltransferase [Alkalilimnicola sp. S0819]|uniref:methyltransferase n=1 Tax=Alkalilimnicola sp. S0819 TaxID=2613922 RepID=UPI0012619C6E|nr:class I SAM-dependent methyltransferase [Alkalilimnicola sp. S0819]KAB7624302.1 class I SAM-dependent methyltransferase [Alkalilimnicola sp. S0819]MPQ16126.1 methyltransferase [Alkalilimnicola sp. S0819]
MRAAARERAIREPRAPARLLALLKELRARGYAHTTVTPATHARVNGRKGQAWARDINGVLGWSRPFSGDVLPGPLLSRLQAADLLEQVPGGWRSRVRVSSLDGVCYLHSAWPTQDPRAVFFGPDSHRFAHWLSEWLAHCRVPPARAVDIGCGAGPGAVTVARHCPQAEVWGVDINDRALAYAAASAEAAGLDGIRWRHGDLLQGLPGEFDLIVANPPYLLDAARRQYRHGGGARGEGLSLRILECALERLAPAGTLLLYTGAAMVRGADPFLARLQARLAGEPVSWRYRELDPDVFGEELEQAPYADVERIAAVGLQVCRPGRCARDDRFTAPRRRLRSRRTRSPPGGVCPTTPWAG